MSYLALLKARNRKEATPSDAALAAQTTFDSFDSARRWRVSENNASKRATDGPIAFAETALPTPSTTDVCAAASGISESSVVDGHTAPSEKGYPDVPSKLPEGPVDPGVERRYARALAMLADHPNWRIAVVTEVGEAVVVVGVAIRGVGYGEVEIPSRNYDPFVLLDLLEERGGGPTVH